MKILITVPSITPGSGLSRYVLTLAKILMTGNDIVVLTTHDSLENRFGKHELHKINPGIKLIEIGNWNKYLRYVKAITIINKLKPDIIINNYNGLIQYILPYLRYTPKVIHILHNDTDDFYRIGSINAKKVDRWIAPTQAIADNFNSYTSNKYKEKTIVIPHGVEPGVARAKKSDKLEIVFAGVLYEHKGVKELPQIIKGLHRKGIDFHFTIIGSGILEDWLKEQFQEDREKGYIKFTGVISHDDVYRYMSTADIFLYPTHIDAFGLVIAEAMINGAIPIVSHLPGITDNLIDDKKNGYLIEIGNIDKFITTIQLVSNNKANGIGYHAKIKAEKFFSISAMKDAYLKELCSQIN